MADESHLPVYVLGAFKVECEVEGVICCAPGCQRPAELVVAGIFLARIAVQRVCTPCAAKDPELRPRPPRPKAPTPAIPADPRIRPTASVSRQRVVTLFELGMRIHDIAATLNCTRSAVNNAIKQHRRAQVARTPEPRSTFPDAPG